MKTNKYIYYWIIQGWYGYGWEDLSSYDQKEYKYNGTQRMPDVTVYDSDKNLLEKGK